MPKVKALEGKVTGRKLGAKGACTGYMDRFARLFPEGTKITRKSLCFGLGRTKQVWWFSCTYLGLREKTYMALGDIAREQCWVEGIDIHTPVSYALSVGYCKIYADVLADYLELP